MPDTTSVVVGPTRANVDFSGSPGDIVIYKGPLPMATDGQNALKVILTNTPSFVHVNWDLGFPGGITIDTSNPLEIRVLSQDGSDRTVVDFVVGDLSATWGFNTFDTEVKCVKVLGVPVACSLFVVVAEVFFDFTANPAIDGFVSTYERIGVQDLKDPAFPKTQPNEYVPRVSILVDDFSHFAASAGIEICISPVVVPLPPKPNCVVPPPFTPLPFFDIDTDLLGSFNFDWWDQGGDFLGDPDYVDNNPWDFWPLLHDQNDHLFPFGP